MQLNTHFFVNLFLKFLVRPHKRENPTYEDEKLKNNMDRFLYERAIRIRFSIIHE